jgi:hypothetical protein
MPSDHCWRSRPFTRRLALAQAYSKKIMLGVSVPEFPSLFALACLFCVVCPRAYSQLLAHFSRPQPPKKAYAFHSWLLYWGAGHTRRARARVARSQVKLTQAEWGAGNYRRANISGNTSFCNFMYLTLLFIKHNANLIDFPQMSWKEPMKPSVINTSRGESRQLEQTFLPASHIALLFLMPLFSSNITCSSLKVCFKQCCEICFANAINLKKGHDFQYTNIKKVETNHICTALYIRVYCSRSALCINTSSS